MTSFMHDDRLQANGIVISETDSDGKINVEVTEVASSGADNKAELAVTEIDSGVGIAEPPLTVKAVHGGNLDTINNNHRDYSKLLVDNNASNYDKINPYGDVARLAVKNEDDGPFTSQTYYNDFVTSWSDHNSRITAGYADPFGGNNASLIEEVYGGPEVWKQHRIEKTYANLRVYFIDTKTTIYAKAGTRQWLRIYIITAGAPYAWFDVRNGVTGTISHGTANIIDVGNGWYRCEFIPTNTYSSPSVQLSLGEKDDDSSYPGANPSAPSMYIYGYESFLDTGEDIDKLKSRDSHWALHEHEYITNADASEVGLALHNDGTVLMKSSVYALAQYDGEPGAIIKVCTKPEDGSWGSYVTVADNIKTEDNSLLINPHPAFVTIPNIGTILFCFGFDEYSDPASFKAQKIFMYLTKDHGVSWEKYGETLIEPYYGGVETPVLPYAYEEVAVLKATYHENTLVLGMMLQGSGAISGKGSIMSIKRIMNVMYSKDLGKSFTTVKSDFIFKTFEGGYSSADMLYGSSSSALQLPTNFAIGFDYNSGKFVIAMRGAGLIHSSVIGPSIRDRYSNTKKWYFFYNADDDLDRWESSVVSGVNYKPVDEFDKDTLKDDYYSEEITAASADWGYTGYCLYQNDITNAAPTRGVADEGTHLIRQREVFLNSVVAGAETPLANIVVEWSSEQPNAFLTETAFREISVRFYGDDYIGVFLDGTCIIFVSDNDLRTGQIGLLSNSAGTNGAYDYKEGFKELGLLTSLSGEVIQGSFRSTSSVRDSNSPYYYEDLFITNDHNNDAWLSSEVTSIDFHAATGPTTNIEYSSGAILQKFRLEKDIVRVDGKFLGREIYQVKFGDEKDYHFNAGYFLNHVDWGIANTFRVDATYVYKVRLKGFVWHNNGPEFLAFGPGSTPRVGLLKHAGYSNKSINQILNSGWTLYAVNGSPANPDLVCGFNRTSLTWSISTTEDYIRVRESGTTDQYMYKEYYPATDTLNSNCETADPIRFFDFYKRGVSLFIKSRSWDSNTDGRTYRIAVLKVPAVIDGTANRYYIEVKVMMTCSNAGVGSLILYYYNGASWVLIDTVNNLDTSADSGADWLDIILHIVPVELGSDASNPELHAFYKFESEELWKTMLPTLTDNKFAVIRNSSTVNSKAKVQFGVEEATGVTVIKHEFKQVYYADTCYYDPNITPILGESVKSGLPIKTLNKVSAAVSGGKVSKDDEWNITDVNARNFPKENIVDSKASVLWKSADDDTDKSIIIDSQENLSYDTVVLYNTNCREIIFDFNNTNSFPSGNAVTLDMTDPNFEDKTLLVVGTYMLEGGGFAFKVNQFKKDQLVNKMIRVHDTSPYEKSVYRVLKNDDNFLTLWKGPTAWNITSTIAVSMFHDRIAFRFPTVRSHRYFKITFKKEIATTVHSTPDGYFQLGFVQIGELHTFPFSPEYPEILEHKPVIAYEKFRSGMVRGKELGNVVTKRTLNFNAVSTDPQQFGDELRYMWGGRVMPVTYIPNIEDIVDATNGVHKTFDLMACYLPPKLSLKRTHGQLTNIAMVLEENIK